jgi:hypothetical protein
MTFAAWLLCVRSRSPAFAGCLFGRKGDASAMKQLAILFLLGAAICAAEDITLTKPAVLKTERSIVSLKAGTVVELLSRDDKTLTVRFNKLTGTIPANSVAAAESPKKNEPKPSEPPRKAETTYGKAVEKAKDNAAKHDKNAVKPTDEIMQDK